MEKTLSLIKFFFKVPVFIFLFFIIIAETEIEIEMQKLQLIVSLTTNKENMKSLSVDRFIKTLLNQTLRPYKILLSIKKKDITYLSNYLISLINKNIIEVIYVKEDFESFNKYYYIPNNYKNFIIIVFDNNITLEKNSIKKLFKSYYLYPNAISARRVYKMKFNKQWNLKPFEFWKKDYKKLTRPKFYLFAIHGEGALFPPNTLNFTNEFIYSFKKAIDGHDFILKYFELYNNLKTVYVSDHKKYYPLDIHLYQKYSELFSVSPNEIQLKKDFGKKYNSCIYNNIIQKKREISNETANYFLKNTNKNIITNDILLVSMTSYPKRIFGIFDVFLSLLNQSADINSYQCFLTLSKEEFIEGVKNLSLNMQKLIENGWVKLIWYHNIYSHKKLMPILKIYPENDILLVDDDIIRNYNFIEIFQRDHINNPKDVICGVFIYYYDNLEMRRLKGYKTQFIREINPVPNIIFQTARPSNGFGGILYPKHTFSDKRFFNESLYMNLSLTSDELWQYAFIIIENKILRQTSIIIDNSFNFVNNSQTIGTTLSKINKKNYPLINNRLINYFEEYKNNTFKRQKKIIVSLTSTKYRFKNLNLVLESIYNNTMQPSKIVLTVNKKDFFFLIIS